jgi:hypothetical protein
MATAPGRSTGRSLDRRTSSETLRLPDWQSAPTVRLALVLSLPFTVLIST